MNEVSGTKTSHLGPDAPALDSSLRSKKRGGRGRGHSRRHAPSWSPMAVQVDKLEDRALLTSLTGAPVADAPDVPDQTESPNSDIFVMKDLLYSTNGTMQFNGSDDIINAGNDPSFTPDNITFIIDINPETGANNQQLASWDIDARSHALLMFNGTRDLQFVVTTDSVYSPAHRIRIENGVTQRVIVTAGKDAGCF